MSAEEFLRRIADKEKNDLITAYRNIEQQGKERIDTDAFIDAYEARFGRRLSQDGVDAKLKQYADPLFTGNTVEDFFDFLEQTEMSSGN